MKILHIIPTLDPVAGGPPMVAIRLAAAQAMLGHDVSYLCYEPSTEGRARIDTEVARIPSVDKVRRVFFPPVTRLERLVARRAMPVLRAEIANADAVHIHGLWEAVLSAAGSLARRFGKPYVVVPHGMLQPWAMRQNRLKKQLALSFGFRKLLSEATAVQFLNAEEQRQAGTLGLATRGVVIPNGIFLQEVDPLPAPGMFRRVRPQIGGCPYVLFLGRLAEQKGVDLLIDAFGEIAFQDAQIRLVLAGPDFGALDAAQSQIASARLSNRIDLVGPLYGRDKWTAMVDAACFCLPSRHEGFSLTVIEAMAAGTPVVISRECHFPEVPAAGAGIVTATDAHSLAESLQKLTRHPEQRALAGVRARALVESKYTWDRVAIETIKAYGGA